MIDLSQYNIFRSLEQEILSLTRSSQLPRHCVVVRYDPNSSQQLQFGFTHDPELRMMQAVVHLEKIMSHNGADNGKQQPFSFVFQPEDQSIDVHSASWEVRPTFENVCLVPDLYYTMNLGYREFFSGEVPAWGLRENRLFWRGTTTGPLYFTVETLSSLPRFRLCDISSKFGDRADVKFYSVVQTAGGAHDAVVNHLKQIGLMGEWEDISKFANYKYIMQIGGNATSWGLVQKLRLGCCILFVEGAWRSWHEQYLKPWIHYVPVRADLADFEERVQWCFDNDAKAMEIGAEGRKLALGLNYDQELTAAANSLRAKFA